MPDARHELDRLVDACRNRVAEGLRTLEDLARFVLDDAAATESLKRLRHDLHETIAAGWRQQHLLAARDVANDTGTSLQTPGESARGSSQDIATAASGRVREGLRSLEEAAKTVDGDIARALKRLRYEATEVAGRLCARLAIGGRRQWRLCLLLSVEACRSPWEHVLRGAIEGGVDCVQVREKHMADGPLCDHARAIVERAHAHDVPVIINDRPDIAMASGADGVHLGQRDLSVASARRVLGSGPLIGVSTHGVDEACAALKVGADVIGIGPIFASGTRPDLEAAGPGRIVETLDAIGEMPHLAIGGIDMANIGQVAVAGARGVAVGAAICSAEDPATTAHAIAAALEPAVAP